MKTDANFLKLAKAKLSQKYYEKVKENVDNKEEIDDNIFNLADFNNDGKVNDDDKNLFEEYINTYSDLFSDSDIQSGYSLDDLISSYDNETASQDDSVDTALDNQNGNLTINELKEKYSEAQEALNAIKTKYQKAKQNKETAEKRLQSASNSYLSSKSTYESANSHYQEVLHKKMAQSQKSSSKDNNKSSKLDSEVSKAKKARDKASRNMSLKQSAYGVASSNVSFYDNASLNYKVEYNSLLESYGALANEFTSMYDSLSDAEKEAFGENPFTLE